MRTRLRVPYPGKRFPDAQAGHQDAEKGPGPAGACVQDVQSHQESHTSRAQGPVRREKRMRRVVRAVAIMARARDHRLVFRRYTRLFKIITYSICGRAA